MAFDPTKIGAEFRYNDFLVTSVAGVSTPIIPANPYRVALFVQPQAAAIQLRPNLAAGATLGWNLPAGAAPFILKLSEVGPLVQQQFNSFSGGGSNVYVSEVCWVSPSGD